MKANKLFCLFVLLIISSLAAAACSGSGTGTLKESRETALEFVKLEATYRFDGIPETLKVKDSATTGGGWIFTIEFDSRHAGYGNRSGQILAEVITRHTAEVKVQDSLGVTAAVMDGVWDMVNQRMLDEMEIKIAPVHKVEVLFMESYPVQVGVQIQIGLSDGCTTFHDAVVTREGNTVTIEVTVQRPRDKTCTAIYTFYDKNLNLGSSFTAGVTYTLKVNDYTTTFEYPR